MVEWKSLRQNESKEVAYAMLVGRKVEDGRRMNMVKYKATKKDAKLAVKTTKMKAFKCLYAKLGDRGGIKSCTCSPR